MGQVPGATLESKMNTISNNTISNNKQSAVSQIPGYYVLHNLFKKSNSIIYFTGSVIFKK